MEQTNLTPAPKSAEDKLVEAVAAEKRHKDLALQQGIQQTMLYPHYRAAWNQLAEGCFKWFQHQGFWPADYGPAIAKDESLMAYVTLSRQEYTRLKKAEKIALIHSELSEALEAVRKGDLANEVEEMADVEVRLLDYCGGFGFDLGEAFHHKMLKNYKRPYRHGKGF